MKKHIVVIEDDATLQALIKFRLNNAGYDVIQFTRGEEALAYITKNKKTIDLIILDLLLPHFSGTDVLIHLREDKFKVYIPVIVLTALTLEKDIVKHLELGADDYIKKPFYPKELVARIKRLL